MEARAAEPRRSARSAAERPDCTVVLQEHGVMGSHLSLAVALQNRSPGLFRALKNVYKIAARPSKHSAELAFWKMRHLQEGGRFSNGHCEPRMLAMLGGLGEGVLHGATVGDFGCGPRGSLAWLSDRARCIGIDVLVPKYLEAFEDDMRAHRMEYVACSETFVPLPDAALDVLFTSNALDHVDNLEAMTAELIRVLRPGGLLVGSFNLGEPATLAEPQSLSRTLLDSTLLHAFETISCRSAPKFSDDPYAGFFGRKTPTGYSGPEILWFVGRKR